MKKSILLTLCAMLIFAVPAFAADKITAAMSPVWPPMEMVDLNKEVVGYDIDIIRAVAEELGLTLALLPTAWDGIFATLESKQSDVITSCVTITDARKKNYLFSQPYYEVRQALIVPADSTIVEEKDMEGKTIGVQIGTSAVEALKKSGLKINIKTYDDLGLVFEDLKNGRLDGVMCDDPAGRFYANRKEDFSGSMKLAFMTADKEDIGFVFRKSDEELVTKVNAALNTIRENGKEAEIQAKWFGSTSK